MRDCTRARVALLRDSLKRKFIVHLLSSLTHNTKWDAIVVLVTVMMMMTRKKD